MGGGIPKPAQISEAVGGDSDGSREEGRTGTVPGSDVQCSGTVGVTLWKRDIGDDQGDAQGPDGVPPSGSATDHGDDGEMWGRLRVGVSSGRGGDGLRGTPPHQSIHKETTDYHSGEGGLTSCICTVNGGGEYYGENTDGALVGSRRIK